MTTAAAAGAAAGRGCVPSAACMPACMPWASQRIAIAHPASLLLVLSVRVVCVLLRVFVGGCSLMEILGLASNLQRFPHNEIQKGRIQMAQAALDEERARLARHPGELPLLLPLLLVTASNLTRAHRSSRSHLPLRFLPPLRVLHLPLLLLLQKLLPSRSWSAPRRRWTSRSSSSTGALTPRPCPCGASWSCCLANSRALRCCSCWLSASLPCFCPLCCLPGCAAWSAAARRTTSPPA